MSNDYYKIKTKDENGITLVALVITIIVLLILAGITVHTLFDSGIISKAKSATDKYNQEAKEELKKLDSMDKLFDDEDKEKFTINLISSLTGEVIQGNCILNIYSDEACSNLIRKINIASSDYVAGSSYKTTELLDEGTYYVVVEQSPTGYNKPYNTFIHEIVKDKENIWNIVLPAGMLLPSSGYNDGFRCSEEVPLFEDYSSVAITLTVKPFVYDLSIPVEEEAQIVCDIYKIGTYDYVNNQYSYESEFAEMNLPELTTEKIYESLIKRKETETDFLKELKYTVLNGYTPAITGVPVNSEIELPNSDGVYLIILRGDGIADYIDAPAYSNTYAYSLTPCIFQPTLLYNEDGHYYRNIEMNLGSFRERRYGTLEIVNNLNGYDIEAENATFVFDIKALYEDKVVFSDVAMINHTGEGQESVMIENIPSNSVVTVECVYNSIGYSLVTNYIQEKIIESGDILSLGFTFDCDNKLGKSAYSEIQCVYNSDESNFELKNGTSKGNSLNVISDFGGGINTIIKNTRNENTEYYLRLKVFATEQCIRTYGGSNKWTPGADGYFYYSDILRDGESTEEFNTKFDIDDLLYEFEQNFNIIIVAECVEVQYREDGTPYADWSAQRDYTSP